MKKRPKLLLIGSMTRSVAKYDDGIRKRFGGGVAYGGRVAVALGITAEIITIGAEDIESGVEELRSRGINIRRIPRKVSNNFFNDYRGKRQLRMKNYIKKPISKRDFKQIPDSEGVLFFPGFHEISSETLDIFKGKTIFLDLGGLIRAFGEQDREGYHLVNQGHWDTIDDYRNKVDVLKVSHEDLENIKFDESINTDIEKMQNLAESGFPIVLFTKAEKGMILVRKGELPLKIPTVAVQGDPAGAGEVFSVGFMAKYLETMDPMKAAAFGNACASLKVSGEDYNYGKAEERANQILLKVKT